MRKPSSLADFWSVTRESLPPAQMRAHVLAILADGKPRTPRDIAWPNGLLPTAVRAALLDLTREGRVTRTGEPGHHVYSLTPAIDEPATLAPVADVDAEMVD